MVIRRHIRRLLLSLLFTASVAVVLADVIELGASRRSIAIDVAVPVLVDHGSQLSVDDVHARAAEFTPVDLADLSLTALPSAVWLRLDLRVAAEQRRDWQLLLEGNGFRAARLYYVEPPSNAFRQIMGNVLPASVDDGYQRALFALPLVRGSADTSGPEVSSVYLNFVAIAPPQIRLTAWDDGRQTGPGAFQGLGEPAFGILTVMTVMALLVGLFWRDPRLLLLSGVAAAGLVALLLADGRVWQFQGLGRLGNGSMALVFFSALALFFALRYSRIALHLLPPVSALSRVIFGVELALVVVCALSALAARAWEPALLQVTAALGYAGAALAMFAGLADWRARRRRDALLVVSAWCWLMLAVGAHLFSSGGTFWHAHGLHLAVAVAIMLLGVAYIEQIMRLRSRYELQIARSGVDANMWRVERSRRNFAAEVHELIEKLDPNLYEEAIMARFLEYLSNMIPVAAAAVAVSHRGDVRLVVVGQDGAQDEFESVLATREQLLQSVCLSDRAAVIHSDDLGVNAAGDISSCLGIVPLAAERDEWAGVLLARSGDLEFGLDELELVHDFAHQAQDALRNAQQFRKVKRQAETDSLTGLLNRRALLLRGRRYYKKHRSLKTALSLLFIDIDFFKRVNDQWGHEVGDRALRRVAEVCSECLREKDFIGRYGGEEFLAVLPGANAKEAQLVAERLRGAVEKQIISVGDTQFGVTVSVGISELSDTFTDLETMLRAADRALYRAKREGRNRVIHHRFMLRGDRVSKPFSS